MDIKELINISNLEDNNFWHASRRDLLARILSRVSDKTGTKGWEAFEVGVGCGKNLEFLRDRGFSVEGIDVDATAVNFSRTKNLEVWRKAVEDHKFVKQYDLVLMMDVLEHIKDDAECIKKLSSGIKANGYLYLTVPAFQFMFGPHDMLCHHHRRYELHRVMRIVKDAGLSIEKISYWNGTFFLPVAVFKVLRRLLFNGNLASTNPDLGIAPEPANSVIISILKLENTLIERGLRIPFGSSVVCLARKPG